MKELSKIKTGDLAQYMSRKLLVIDIDQEWIHGIEFDSTVVGRYKKNYVRKIENENESR